MTETAAPEPYPMRTEPLLRDYIWGGRNLAKLGKELPKEGVWAESWEVIDHPEHQSRVTNGPLAGKNLREITSQHTTWLLGDQLRPHDQPRQQHDQPALPLLLKYLDCNRVLSVQVHPDDAYGATMTPPDLGKTEAWYIISAEPDAVLYAGLKAGVSADQVRHHIAAGTLVECLHEINPSAGDCVFIPAGTVHALGAGLVVAEIQQSSNTTFRLYDWDRVGSDGQPRALHIEQAIEVIDFQAGPREIQSPKPTDQTGRVRLAECDKFVLDRLSPAAAESLSAELPADNGPHLLTSPTGGVTLSWPGGTEVLEPGDSVLVPAAMQQLSATVVASCELLDMYLPTSSA